MQLLRQGLQCGQPANFQGAGEGSRGTAQALRARLHVKHCGVQRQRRHVAQAGAVLALALHARHQRLGRRLAVSAKDFDHHTRVGNTLRHQAQQPGGGHGGGLLARAGELGHVGRDQAMRDFVDQDRGQLRRIARRSLQTRDAATHAAIRLHAGARAGATACGAEVDLKLTAAAGEITCIKR